jgi:hypothetical protein
MCALERGWRRLGSVLVEAGLISEDDLIEALSAQEHSGRRLGEILVARGLVSGPAVANALAEQHGSFFKSEHGFGTGLRSSIERDSEPPGEAPEPKKPPLSDLQGAMQPEDRPAHTPGGGEDDDPHRATGTANTAERQQASAASASAPSESTDAPERDAFTQATASTDQQSENELETDALPESEHLLFVPTPHGYLLLEQSGAPPDVGDLLELPEGPVDRAVVTKVTSSPLPQDRRACAYLQPL